MNQPNFFDDPKTTTSPQKQDTGIPTGLPPYMPKSAVKNVEKMFGGDQAKMQQFAKNYGTKLDNR